MRPWDLWALWVRPMPINKAGGLSGATQNGRFFFRCAVKRMTISFFIWFFEVT